MIAIIAGTGSLPVEACHNLRKDGKDFFVVSLFPEDNQKQLEEATQGEAPVITQAFYKPGKVLSLLEEYGATKALLIGKVDKRNLLKKVKLDWLGVKLLASLLVKNDSAIMEKILQVLADRGIQVIKQDEVLGSLFVPPGVLTGTLNDSIKEDITFGIQTAQKLSQCDIGQTVVVKDKMVLAVEAIEGTDNCIKRGIELGQKGVIICKAARTDQNRKFDLPTLGPKSLEGIKKGEVSTIAWLSTHTFIAEKEKFIQQARDLGITLVSHD